MRKFLFDRLPSFARRRDGNIALTAGMMMIAVVGAVGAAVDFQTAYSERSKLQSHLDAALLASVQQDFASVSEQQAFAQQFIDQAYGVSPTAAKVTLKELNGAFHATADIAIPTSLLQIVGIGDVPIQVDTRVTALSGSPQDFALVLDVTDSMQGDKIEALKVAANTLIENLEGSAQTRFGVVPFAEYVNIGVSHGAAAGGLDIPEDEPAVTTCEMVPVQACVEVETQCTESCTKEPTTCYSDGVPYSCEKRQCTAVSSYSCTKTECTPVATGEMEEQCSTSRAKLWTGYVGSRDGDLDREAAAGSNPIPALLGSEKWPERSPILPLTNQTQTVKDAIAALETNGETYMAPGVLWGWRLLNAQAPFPNQSDPKKVKRIMVLMSDGINTVSKSDGSVWHGGKNRNDADEATLATCTAAKKDGVEIYTVAYDIDDLDGQALLRACATHPKKMFFLAVDSEELVGAFEAIGKSVGRFRISG